MNNKRLFSRFLAVTLAITLIFSVFSVSAGAVSADEKSNLQNANVQDNLSVSGTNSLGTMLANEIADKNEETEDNNGYNVFSVAVSGNNAVVSFETITDATLLVAIYNESCDTLIATGTTEVTNGETEKNVTLDTNDMPQYFYVKGYLIDTTTNKPLCTAYSSPMYTKDMQEFLSKTTDDFEENKVLNFNNDDDNNFAVYKDEVKLVDESGGTNKVTKSDDTTKTYVIENIDDSISSLSEGDIFSYDYSNGDALIVKVASITIDGTTATITGEDANLDDVFDYVKIDSTAKKSDFTYDESTVGEGVSILSEQKSRKSRAIDISGSASWSVPFSVSYVDNGVNVKGSLTYGSSVYVKVYLSIQYQYLELKVDQTLKLDLSVSTNLFESSIDLFEFGVSPIAGVYVTVTPALVIEGSINCSISATMKTTNGFSVSNTEGYKDLTTNPKLETKLDFSGSVFIGAKATLKIRVLGSLVEGGFTLKNGVDISGKFDDTKDSSSKKHNCSACIKGDIYKKIGGSIYIKFLNSKNLKLELSLNVKTKISDFYYSLEHQTFDFTTCPYISYKVNIIVKNSNGSFVSGASVNGTATTDSDGKVTMYLPNGNHTFTASYNGQTESTTTTVNNAETTAEIVLGTSQSNPDYNFNTTGEIVQVVAGGSHSATVTKDGSLYMWGWNFHGQLGDGTTTDRYTPVKIMDNVASVSLGGYHSAAITKDSNLYMWGGNGNGQLGDGITTNRNTPVKIMDNVASVSLGGYHSAAITKNGSLYTWGYNEYGQLGDGTTTDRTSPVAIQIYDHTNVLKSTKKSSESVSASSGQHISKFAGYNANGIYNFYALKNKNADKLLSDDNILYVDQVRADANGNISVTYTPKTAYDSPYEFVASITQIDISNADVTAESFTYNGKLQTVEPVVKVNGYTLYSGIDYTLSGAYIAKNAGEYTYTIVGKGDFVGYITKTFTINSADLNNCDVLIPDSATYTGKEIKPNAVVKIGDVTIEKDVDYTVEYQNNLNVGIGSVVIKGKGNYSGRKVCRFDITNCDISEISKIDIQDCAYYRKAVVPEMVLENNGTSLVKDKDYTVTFKNNDSVGTATAVINGIGNYSGTIEKTFQIKLPIGDIDMSETIDVKDATLVMQYGVKLIDLSDEQLIIADVNNDNIVNIKDATMIQKYIVNLIDSFVR